VERKTARLEPFDDPESIEEQETQKLPATDARGSAALPPTDSTSLGSTALGMSRSPLVIPRRTLLIAGGGVVAAGGTLVIAKEAHLASRIRNALLRVYDHASGQIAARHGPQPLPDGPMQTPNDVVVFNGALSSGWDDWSWADRKVPEKSVSYNGHPVLSMTLGSWSGLQFHHNIFDTTGLGYFQCWVRGVGRGGQDVKVFLVDDLDNWLGDAYLGDYTQGGSIAADTWRLVRVPLQALASVSVNAQNLIIQAFSAQSQGQIYLADLRFVYHPDLQPAGIERVTSLDLNTISLRFAQPMDATMAANIANYLVAAAAGTNDAAFSTQHPVAPSIVRYYTSNHSVSLTLPRQLHAGGKYTVTVSPIKDKFGVATKPGLQARVQVTSQPLTLATDVEASRHPISPEIYGVSDMDPAQARALGVTLLRWGGETNTRYNWKLGNAWNLASDWYFENNNFGLTAAADSRPSGVADSFVEGSRSHGIGAMVTIPTIGWVAKNSDQDSKSLGVPGSGGPPLQPNGDAIKGYDPTENRRRTSVQSRARKKAPFSDPPNLSDPTVAQDEWVYHLTRRFGPSANGGVRYYAMDNEPELWGVIHRDIRPAYLSYEQMRDIFLDYATAVKDVDRTAMVTGPVVWYPNFDYSPLDRGTDNFATHADFNAHGGVPFMQWWLSEVQKHDALAGRRSLDVLDLHYYPQGLKNSDYNTPAIAAQLLRMTRSLWDPNYTDESWVNRKVRLIPQMRDWVNAHYPGTKLALSEWSWGAEDLPYGAVALAEVLGIFGREGLDIACHWGGIDPKSPGGQAFKLYGNYDGAGHRFGGTAFKAISTNDAMFTGYTADTGDGAILLMLINKSFDTDLTPQIRLDHLTTALGGAVPSRARVWRYWPNLMKSIQQGPDITLPSGSGSQLTLTYTLPALSMTLLRIEAGS
jgi:Glycoside hydrolase family 44